MYIRFVVGTDKEDISMLHGPFAEARMLLEGEKLYRYEVERVSEIFYWFNQYLPCPPFEKSKWPKNAITWFKVSAQEYISKLYEIQVISTKQNDLSSR